jgi:hypothetical protein
VSVVWQRISDATAGEGLPFLSPTRPRDKAFLSNVHRSKSAGRKFRLWKWPSGSRGGNRLVPVFYADVTATDDGSTLTGYFQLHPYARFFPWFTSLLMLGIAATVWFQDGIQGKLFAGFFLLMSVGFVLFALQDRSPRTQEEEQIVNFLENVFADVRASERV